MSTGTVHRMVVQVSRDDAEGMNLALNNLVASKQAFDREHEPFQAELVAYGPGIAMLRADVSPVKERIESTRDEIPELVLSMCGNAKAAAEGREGHPIAPLPGVRVVPSGVVRVMQLQEQGWTYIRP
jgi:intracellular sulfur oxidation DsrE/DsrF family protein